jgi:superfamily I DNA/RNA helicase
VSGPGEARGYRLVRPAGRASVAPTLEPGQQAVVDHPGGPLLVLAGPGSGKTTTLVEAAVRRVADGADPESLLLLTFSRRAATELRERITARLARTTREPLARTFHSYAFGLLRAQAVARGELGPRLLTGAEQDIVVRELLGGQVEDGAGQWPDGFRPALLTRGFATELRDLLLRAVERGVGPARLAGWGRERGRDDWVAAAHFFDEYLDVTTLATGDGAEAYDPAELIRAALDALVTDPELLARERARRRRVFVDEYQDLDPAQEELLRMLAGGADELVAVGDPDQSIYAFRGSDPYAIRRFPDVFAPADGTPVPTVALGVSRRSGTVLLEHTRRVAARLPGPAAHRALTPVPGTPPGRVEVHVLRTPGEEAAYVAHRLRAAHLLDGVPWREMAVLVRSTERHLPALRRALAVAGVPASVAGDDLPLVQQPAVAPFLRLLECALWGLRSPGEHGRVRAESGPDPLDEDAAVTLLTSPLGGADALSLRRLRQELRRLDLVAGGAGGSAGLLVGLLKDCRGAADPGPGREPGVAAAVAAADRMVRAAAGDLGEPARRVGWLLATARATARAGGSAEEVLWAVWSASGLGEQWQRLSRLGGPAGAGADRDLDAVVALFDAAAKFVDRLPRSGPRVLVDHLVAQQIPGDTLAPKAPTGDTVRLLTAHAAKGLEWAVVAVAGVQEGSWPDLRRRGTLLGVEDLVDVAAGREATESVAPLLDEERRLFYVACTRARRTLIVSGVAGEEDQPSRFLDELDPPPPGTPRPVTSVPRALSLPALVAELRSVVSDPKQGEVRRRAAAGELATLATAGVAGADPEQWWGLAGLSDERALADPGQAVPVSPSALDRFVGCELRWLMEAVGARGSEQAAQSVGTALHDVAAAVVAEGLDPADVGDRLEAALERLDLGGAWTTRRERARARDMLTTFLRWHRADAARHVLVGVEVPFTVEVPPDGPGGHPALLRGQVDRLERDEAGRLVVVDLKTGRSKPAEGELARHPQLGAYQLAVAAGAFGPGEEPGGGLLVNLGTAAERNRVQEQPALGADADPDWAADRVRAAAAGMGGAVFRATPGSACRICAAKVTCPATGAGRQVTE